MKSFPERERVRMITQDKNGSSTPIENLIWLLAEDEITAFLPFSRRRAKHAKITSDARIRNAVQNLAHDHVVGKIEPPLAEKLGGVLVEAAEYFDEVHDQARFAHRVGYLDRDHRVSSRMIISAVAAHQVQGAVNG